MIIKLTINPTVAPARGFGFAIDNQQRPEQEIYIIQVESWKEVNRKFKKFLDIHNRRPAVEVVSETANEPTQFFTTAKVCNWLKISERTCRRWRKDGKLPFIKQGRNVLIEQKPVIEILKTKIATNGFIK